jgi:hypothetical protein
MSAEISMSNEILSVYTADHDGYNMHTNFFAIL